MAEHIREVRKERAKRVRLRGTEQNRRSLELRRNWPRRHEHGSRDCGNNSRLLLVLILFAIIVVVVCLVVIGIILVLILLDRLHGVPSEGALLFDVFKHAIQRQKRAE